MKKTKKQALIAILSLALAISIAPRPETLAAAKPAISKAKATMEIDSSLVLTVSGLKSSVVWSAPARGNVTIAVSKDGLSATVTAQKTGKGTVIATSKEKKYECEVTVVDSNVKSPAPIARKATKLPVGIAKKGLFALEEFQVKPISDSGKYWIAVTARNDISGSKLYNAEFSSHRYNIEFYDKNGKLVGRQQTDVRNPAQGRSTSKLVETSFSIGEIAYAKIANLSLRYDGDDAVKEYPLDIVALAAKKSDAPSSTMGRLEITKFDLSVGSGNTICVNLGTKNDSNGDMLFYPGYSSHQYNIEFYESSGRLVGLQTIEVINPEPGSECTKQAQSKFKKSDVAYAIIASVSVRYANEAPAYDGYFTPNLKAVAP